MEGYTRDQRAFTPFPEFRKSFSITFAVLRDLCCSAVKIVPGIDAQPRSQIRILPRLVKQPALELAERQPRGIPLIFRETPELLPSIQPPLLRQRTQNNEPVFSMLVSRDWYPFDGIHPIPIQMATTKAKHGMHPKSIWKTAAYWFSNTPDMHAARLPKNRHQKKSWQSGLESHARGE